MRFWFGSDRETDRHIAGHFAPTLHAASQGLLEDWETHPRGCLALTIVLDQFPRNINRGTAAAFQHDALALAVTRRGLSAGHLRALATLEQAFLLMPFQHCEDLACQREGVALFERMHAEAPSEWLPIADNIVQYARLHAEIIERFDRFPHRNAVLGRASTPEEIEFLKSNTESFGQGAEA